ncbi:MAG TPA: hypothetical protein VHR66_19790 [Gemmataceae bacterium]|jgi:hypothetical protein|nr:hypothetical protein [Gemmataceae bacterium]
MFRKRLALAVLALMAIAPLVGCANRRCCGRNDASYRPVYVAPAPAPCNSCPTPGGVIPG